nr:neuromedin-U receptor 2-like [Danaus plexippus plexippus]
MLTVGNNTDSDDIYSSYGIGLSLYDEMSNFVESDLIKSILTLFLGTSMVFSLVGNMCTCAVIARDKTMRTPTNCYLLNLAISDLMITVFVPIELYIIWVPDYYPLGEEGCRIHFLLWDLLSNCSVLTILAFTIERYLVISKPFLRQRLLLTSRISKILTLTWVVSCIFSFPSVYSIYFIERKQNVYCVFTVSERDKVFYIAIELLVFFFFPMTVIFVLFIMIVHKLKTTEPKSRANPAISHHNRNKAVKMLAAVAASFFICWSPYAVLRMMIVIPNLSYEEYNDVSKYIHMYYTKI